MSSEEYQRAMLFLTTKKYQDGINYIKSLLTQSPNDDLLHAFMANNYLGLRKFEDAELFIKKAIELNPDEYYYFKTAAKIQILSENPGKAESYVTTAMEMNPIDPDLFGFQSFIYVTKKDFERGLELVDEGLQIDPNNLECLKCKALCHSFLGQKEKAEQVSNHLMSINPDNAQNLYTAGLVSLHQNHNSSEDKLAISLKKTPENPHTQKAYRLALRSQLPGFYKTNKWISNTAEQDSWEAKIIKSIYSGFIAFCFINILSMSMELSIAVPWIVVFLVFWNINLLFIGVPFIQIIVYDIWLFLSNSASRSLYSTGLRTRMIIGSTLILLSLSMLIGATVIQSLLSYQLALHLLASAFLITKAMYTTQKRKLQVFGYVFITMCFGILSLCYFELNLIYFIVFNIIFRIFNLFAGKYFLIQMK